MLFFLSLIENTMRAVATVVGAPMEIMMGASPGETCHRIGMDKMGHMFRSQGVTTCITLAILVQAPCDALVHRCPSSLHWTLPKATSTASQREDKETPEVKRGVQRRRSGITSQPSPGCGICDFICTGQKQHTRNFKIILFDILS